MPSFAASASSGREYWSRELVAALGHEAGPGARGDEHADSSLLVEDPVVDEQVHALAGGGRVDPVERGELVGRGHLGLLGQRAGDDVVLDLLGDLQEDRTTLVHRAHPASGRWFIT